MVFFSGRSHFREIAVSDGEWLGASLHRDRSDAEHAAKFVLGYLHRAGRGRAAWCGLRKGGGAGGVERYRAFYLLHNLVNVAVEHRYWAEASVPQPHSALTVQNGIWANSTMGVEVLLPFKSSASQASCSAPRAPNPPAFRFATLMRPTKCTPFLSNEYQPVPLAWVLFA